MPKAVKNAMNAALVGAKTVCIPWFVVRKLCASNCPPPTYCRPGGRAWVTNYEMGVRLCGWLTHWCRCRNSPAAITCGNQGRPF